MKESEAERQARQLAKLPYRKVIRGDEDDGFLGEVPELPGCLTAGTSEAEALENLQEAMLAWLEAALLAGRRIPMPKTGWENSHSGRLLLRMPRTLHHRLAERAEEEGVSLNQLVVAVLAEGLGSPRPFSLGIGASGQSETARRSEEERPEPRSWR